MSGILFFIFASCEPLILQRKKIKSSANLNIRKEAMQILDYKIKFSLKYSGQLTFVKRACKINPFTVSFKYFHLF